MSEKANYFKIGLFFVAAVVLIVAAAIIWGAGLFTQDKIYFETYFDSAVTGLNVGASVELMGVKIGQVEEIEFASAVYDIAEDPTKVSEREHYIRVLCSISAEESQKRSGHLTDAQRDARTRNMTQQGLRLRLASNILTGQSYLDGVFLDPERFSILEIAWKPEHLYVPSAPGEFSSMKDSVDKILVKLEEIDVGEIADNVNQLLLELKRLIKNPDPNTETVNLPQMMGRLDSILERVDRQTASKSVDVDRFLRNMREISDDIKELTAKLKEHPSEIIFSQPPAKSEMIK